MNDISATDASRGFSDLLDGVEHRGEEYRIMRRGKAVARVVPIVSGRGSDVKTLLLEANVDSAWRTELDELRGLLEVEERP